MSAAAALSDAETKHLSLFLAGLQVLAIEPVEILIDGGVVPDAVAARTLRDDPLTRLLDLDLAALTAFWRLAEQVHADFLSGAR